MPVKHLPRWRAAGIAVGIAAVFAIALFFRLPAFWAPHADPVETAYLSLAFKLGSRSGLEGYYSGRTQIRYTKVSEGGSGERTLPILTPVSAGADTDKFLDAWPQENNPFYFKPPLFSSLIAYSHHQAFKPNFPHYPVLAAVPEQRPSFRAAVLGLQGWAVVVPVVLGLLSIALTLILGWRMFGPVVGIIASLFVAVHPSCVLVSTRIWPEAALTACLLASVVLFQRFIFKNAAGCILAGLTYGLGVLTDLSILFVLPAFFLWALAGLPRTAYPSGRSAAIRRFGLHFGMFMLGAVWIGRCWFDFTAVALGGFGLKPAGLTASADADTLMSFWNQAIRIFIVCPPMLAAFYSLKSFGAGSASGTEASSANGSVRVVWFFVISLIGMRWLFSPHSGWDERALALALPFLALAAAKVIADVGTRCIGAATK